MQNTGPVLLKRFCFLKKLSSISNYLNTAEKYRTGHMIKITCYAFIFTGCLSQPSHHSWINKQKDYKMKSILPVCGGRGVLKGDSMSS